MYLQAGSGFLSWESSWKSVMGDDLGEGRDKGSSGSEEEKEEIGFKAVFLGNLEEMRGRR